MCQRTLCNILPFQCRKPDFRLHGSPGKRIVGFRMDLVCQYLPDSDKTIQDIALSRQ
jgi:hypothetical protein